MDIVRRGVMARRREASCCRVEVMKGGAGLFCFSPRLTDWTTKSSSCVAAITALTSSSLFSSVFFSPRPKKRAVNCAFSSPQDSSASSSQYSSL